jgi:peptidoglycan hydrolase-like protein with peptidoglycan-binding domain
LDEKFMSLGPKSALAQTGHYQVPDFGITPYPDTSMIDGIKKFQKENGLKVDGVMKPQGSTETALGQQTKSISTINPFASTQGVKKPSPPKPSMIDPFTGLPEQKSPKPKMPTAKQWEQVAEM